MMNWFSNLKIKVKLVICFIILALFTGAVGIIGISNMGMINERGDDIYNNNFLASQELAKIQKSLLLIRSEYFLMLYERDTAQFQTRLNTINNLSEETNEILSSYEMHRLTTEESTLLKTLKSNLTDYRQIRAEHIAMVQEGRYDEAVANISVFAGAREKVEQDIQALIDYNIQSAEKKSIDNTEDFKNQSFIMILIIGVGILLAMGIGFAVAQMISKPLSQIVDAADKIAAGDLDVQIDVNTKDEIGILAKAFKKMSDTLHEVMSSIGAASEQVAAGSKQVSNSSMILSQGATEQASSVEELTASLEQISAQTRQNAEDATQANELAENAKSNALKGNTQMQGMLKAMEEINDSSSNISKIIKVIDEIAFQTNILALNAAVEAARAGQHGKGFAVVAEEVRNLAARSANAAKETTDMIEGSIKKVEGGTKIANETALALDSIVAGVSKVAALVSNIAIASNEQALGVEQINQGIMQVSEVVQNNSATSEESAAASEELAGQAELLKEQVNKFKLKRSHGTLSHYRNIEDMSPEVLRMLEQMNEKKNSFKYEAYTENSPSRSSKIALSDNEFGKY